MTLASVGSCLGCSLLAGWLWFMACGGAPMLFRRRMRLPIFMVMALALGGAALLVAQPCGISDGAVIGLTSLPTIARIVLADALPKPAAEDVRS